MYPILFEIGPVKIASYGTMIAIGFLLALYMCERRAVKFGLDKDRIFGLGLTAIISGIIGAKLLYYIVEIDYFIANPKALLDLNSGFVVYGGIIVGVLCGYIYCRRHKLEFGRYFDLVMPSVALAQGFGRIGCFLAGCCYGRETHSHLGVVFTNSPFAPNNVPLLPTQLFSSAGLFILAGVLVWYAGRKERKTFRVAGLYMILYSIGRFVIEFFRDDDRGSVGSLSTSQFISIGIVILGIVIFNLSSILSGKKSKASGIEE